MTFDQLMSDAVFCGYRLLLYRWERAAALADGPTHRARLATAADWLRERMEEDLVKKERMDPAEVASLVLQTSGADRYTSPLIAGRFQVLGSFIGGTYYVVDHHKADLLVRVAGPVSDIRRFASREDANQWACTAAGIQTTDLPVQQQETDVPKNPKVVTDPKPHAKKNQAVEAAPAAPPAKAAKANGERKPTAAALFQRLIMQGKLTDDAIFAKVQEEFGLDDSKRNYVAFYRRYLDKRGENPPAARTK